MAAITLVSASAITITQSVEPAPPPRPRPAPTVRLVAAVQPLVQPRQQGQQPMLSVLLDSPAAPPTALAIPIAPNLANTIDSIYNAVEPWVRYGFQVATSAVSWIPYVGAFAGQIMVFYNFGQSIVASGVYNFTDFLRGDGGIVENLVDFGVDVGLAFVWLGLDEVAQFVPLPPFCCYPPRPPVQGPFLAAETLAAPQGSADLMSAESVDTTKAANQPEENSKDADGGQTEQLSTGPTGQQQAPTGQKQDAIESAKSAEGEATNKFATGQTVDIDAASEEDKHETPTPDTAGTTTTGATTTGTTVTGTPGTTVIGVTTDAEVQAGQPADGDAAASGRITQGAAGADAPTGDTKTK